jgi:hypothetical protein
MTSHSPSDTDGCKVQIHDDTLTFKPVLNNQVGLTPLYSTLHCPTTLDHTLTPDDITASTSRVKDVVLKDGVNGQVTVLMPGFKTPLHRTNSVDYNIFLEGSAWLITPTGTGSGEESRVEVKAGEVAIQRGTLHAWEAGRKGARWVTVVVDAKAVEIEGKPLDEVPFA